MGPVTQPDGHDAPGLVDEAASNIASGLEDFLVGFEDPVGEVVLAQELPDVFGGVELRSP